jgi:hypothetical protein
MNQATHDDWDMSQNMNRDHHQEITHYLHTLSTHLGNHLDREHIVEEFRSHLTEAITEQRAEGVPEDELFTRVVAMLGSPQLVAEAYAEVPTFSATHYTRLFLLQNAFFFVAGSLFVLWLSDAHPQLRLDLWQRVVHYREGLLLAYCLYWLVTGFTLGYLHGFTALRSMSKVVRIPLLLNYLFMLVVLLHIFPGDWFGPLLSGGFVIACVVATFLFSKLAVLGCRFGTRWMRFE